MRLVGQMLADALRDDPLRNEIYESDTDIERKLRAHFVMLVRYCLRYGEVYASSGDLEGAVAWMLGKYADTTAWRIVSRGAVVTVIVIGLKAANKMRLAFKSVIEDRHQHMAGSLYLYLRVVAVASKFQGNGFGSKLIGAAIKKSERAGLILYAGIETEENAKTYEHFGFRVLRRTTLPIVGLPMWTMVREPRSDASAVLLRC